MGEMLMRKWGASCSDGKVRFRAGWTGRWGDRDMAWLQIWERLQAWCGHLRPDSSTLSTFTEDLLCACGGTVDSERRPCLTAVGRENSPEDANHDSSMQHPPVTPRGVCASTLGAPRGRELEHVQHVTKRRALQHS